MATKSDLLDLIERFNTQSKLHADTAILTKLKEEIGEVAAELAVENLYGSRVKNKIVFPKRLNKVPIGDLGFELENREIIWVESKFHTSTRGMVGEEIFAAGDELESGEARILTLRKQVEQLEPKWIQDRINELVNEQKLSTPRKDLANRFRAAINEQKLKVLELRTIPEYKDGQIIGVKVSLLDETQKVRDYYKSGRAVSKISNIERSTAIKEAFLKTDASEATKTAKSLIKEADKADKKVINADKKVKTAEKKLEKAKLKQTTKSKTIERLEKNVKFSKAEARNLEDKANAAKTAAEDAAEDAGIVEKDYNKVKRAVDRQIAVKGEAKFKAKTTEPVLGEIVFEIKLDTVTEKGSDVLTMKNRGLVDAVVLDKGLKDSLVLDRVSGRSLVLVESKAINLRGAEKTVTKIPKTTTRFESVARFVFKGPKLIIKIGKFSFLLLKFFDPLFTLLMAVDIVDGLVEQSKEIQEKKEWSRIERFLVFDKPKRIKTVGGIEYLTSLQDKANQLIETKLSDFNYAKNYLFWLDKWNNEHNWHGFVYSQININLERQTRLQFGLHGFESADKEEPYNVKYYLAGSIDVYFTDKPLANSKDERFLFFAGPFDDRNYTTGGRQLPSPAAINAYNYSVNVSCIQVRYTYPIPTLTPFDFIIFKCRFLISEIVAFLSKYDENIIEGMDIREEENDFLKIYWLEKYEFSNPLNNGNIHFCVKGIFWAIDHLSSHVIQGNDLGKQEIYDNKLNIGHNRRLQILFNLSKAQKEYEGKSIFYEIGLRLNNIVSGLSERHLIKPINNEFKYLTNEYLSKLAFVIDDDLKRTFENCKRNSQFEYALNVIL